MKAVVQNRYGSPTDLQLVEVEKPIPTADQILIKILAVSINGSDKEGLKGRPFYTRINGLFKPRNKILGSDIAGRVEMVGQNVTRFKVGDEIFGEIPGYHGGFAEYVCIRGETMVDKPAGLTFEEAAAIPQGGVIAVYGLKEKGNVQPGQKVLINGAGGSGGSFAIQVAKYLGAEVTGVDHTSKLEFMRSLGADHVIDYSRQDFTRTGERYDLIVDLIAQRPIFSVRRALRPNGTYYFVGGSLAVLFQVLIWGALLGRSSGRKIGLLAVPQSRKQLAAITALCESGHVSPVIDRQFSFDEVPDAMRYVSEGKAKGKVVITV